MFAAALLVSLVTFAPQAGGELKVRTEGGFTLKYDDLSDKDLQAILSSLKAARDVLSNAYAMQVEIDPVVTLRLHPGARRMYWTDGDDRIFFDFPSNEFFFFAQAADERIIKVALPAFVQLWMARSLTSMAGLDPRIADSIVEYADYVHKSSQPPTPGKDPPGPPTGPGRVWYDIEQVYPGTSGLVMNSLATQKVPGHMLGDYLRNTAFALTSDEHVKKLFDEISPPIPLLAAKDVAPSPPLKSIGVGGPPAPKQPAPAPKDPAPAPKEPAPAPKEPAPGAPGGAASANPPAKDGGAPAAEEPTLRWSRVQLFNGVPLFEMAGAPIPATDRLLDFEHVFDWATRWVPDGAVVESPPSVRGVDVWKAYFEFRHRVVRARDDIDYTLVMREFLARFADASLHVGTTTKAFFPPGAPHWSSVVGLSFAEVGGSILVSKVTADSEPEKAGVKRGMQLLEVDGRPAVQVLDTLAVCLRTFESCSSPQRARASALSLLLSGQFGSEAQLSFAAAKGAPGDSVLSIKLPRGMPKGRPPSAVSTQFRLDGVGVLTVPRFDGDALKQYAAGVEELAKKGAKAIVIDLRGNEGQREGTPGGQPSALTALMRIMPKDLPKTAIATEVLRDKESFTKSAQNEIVLQAQPGAGVFAGPVAVLIDAWTGGEAELFALGIAATKRGLIYGARSSGNVTMPNQFDKVQLLDRSRFTVIYSRGALARVGGEPLQSIGLLPNVEVAPTAEDVAAGRDAVLEKAAAALLQ
jgi:C-terminal processing protease CtpA/Prc